MTSGRTPSLPHRGIQASNPKERFALELLDKLWADYRARVPFARSYEGLVAAAGGTFRNDHMAFRSFALQNPADGIFRVARPFEALGWQAETCYRFPEKHLAAVHLRHPNPGFPKVFVSELRVWELSAAARRRIERNVRPRSGGLTGDDLRRLSSLEAPAPGLLRRLAAHFDRPWPAPERADVLDLDPESQYAAWTLLFGRRVNHFTASVNAHEAPPLADIEKTVAALRARGVPMKADIEGGRGSKLRQSATEAAPGDAPVRDRGRKGVLRWPYAYFELAERGRVVDADSGKRTRFEGFLGGQAAQLFEMTKRR